MSQIKPVVSLPTRFPSFKSRQADPASTEIPASSGRMAVLSGNYRKPGVMIGGHLDISQGKKAAHV